MCVSVLFFALNYSMFIMYKLLLGGKKMETILIKYHNDKLIKPENIEGKSDWIDLRAAEDVVLKKGEFKIISLGVSMKLPDGYEAHLSPRSSTFKKWGIIQVNSVGVIDNSYSGDDDICAYNFYGRV